MLYRYAGYKGYDASKTAAIDGFVDAGSVSGYAGEAMRWAVGSGLISGRGNNTLAPTATATRAEVAEILVRFEAVGAARILHSIHQGTLLLSALKGYVIFTGEDKLDTMN